MSQDLRDGFFFLSFFPVILVFFLFVSKISSNSLLPVYTGTIHGSAPAGTLQNNYATLSTPSRLSAEHPRARFFFFFSKKPSNLKQLLGPAPPTNLSIFIGGVERALFPPSPGSLSVCVRPWHLLRGPFHPVASPVQSLRCSRR